jgi:hypothetical protein
MVVHETELLVSCCGNSHGESILLSFYCIHTWMQKHSTYVHARPGIRVCSERVYKIVVHDSDRTKFEFN